MANLQDQNMAAADAAVASTNENTFGYSGTPNTSSIGGAVIRNGVKDTVTQNGIIPVTNVPTSINSSTIAPAAPLSIPAQTGTQTSNNQLTSTVNTLAPTIPSGTTRDANGNIVPIQDSGADNRNSIASLINQLGTKGDATAALNTTYGLDQKTQDATAAYNAYNQAKVKSDQQITGIYGNPSLTRDQATQQASEVSRINNANLANLAVISNSAAGNLQAAQAIIKSKLDAQFQPIQDQIDAREKFAQVNNEDLTASETKTIDTQNAIKLADLTTVRTAAKDIQERLVQNGTFTPAISAQLDSINADYASGKISATDATNRMYEAVGKDGSLNKFTSVQTGYDPQTGQPIFSPFNTITGTYGNGSGKTRADGVPVAPMSPTPVSQSDVPVGGKVNQATNINGATFNQYGLLSNTDFNPNNVTDSAAVSYINSILSSGSLPTASTIGVKGANGLQTSMMFNAAKVRANSLYFAATGQPLPNNPAILKNNSTLINANNTLANNLGLQEETIQKNFGMNLDNLNKNNLNTAYPILNDVLNNLSVATGDPAVSQYFTQNATIQQELGNLLAVKNASGTTVFDKMTSAGLLPKDATQDQQVSIVKTLLKEAENSKSSIDSVNGDLYKSIDPLMMNPANPLREAQLNVNNTGNKASASITPTNTKIEGLTATIDGQGTFTFPDQASLNKFKKDHNIL